jgi:hypothetical protein
MGRLSVVVTCVSRPVPLNLISCSRRFTVGNLNVETRRLQSITLDAQLLLQPQFVPHRQNSLSVTHISIAPCSAISCASACSLQRTEPLILKCLLFLPYFNQNRNPSTNLLQIANVKPHEIRIWWYSPCTWRTDWRTWRSQPLLFTCDWGWKLREKSWMRSATYQYC